jgi:hypothetical protein
MPVAGGPPAGFPANVLQCVPYKKPTDATVYVVGSDWLKHGFTSWSAFLACGFTAADIRADTINNLDLITTGSGIGGVADYCAVGCVPAGGCPPATGGGTGTGTGGLPANVLQCVPYKKPAESTVYVVGTDNLKHGFTTWAAFLAVGFTADDIRLDTINNLDQITTGGVVDGVDAYQAIGCTPVTPPSGGGTGTGRCNSYVVGECTWGACQLASWVKDGWGNAVDWPQNAPLDGLVLTQIPTVGAVVCYGAGHGYSQLGHLGVVVKDHGDGTFDVQEMNYTSFNKYDLRASTLDDVTDFILPPGVSAGGGGTIGPGGAVTPPADLETAWQQFADFWNHSIDQRVDELAAITAALERS